MTVDDLNRMTSAELLDLLTRIGPGWVTSERAAGILRERKLTPHELGRLTAALDANPQGRPHAR